MATPTQIPVLGRPRGQVDPRMLRATAQGAAGAPQLAGTQPAQGGRVPASSGPPLQGTGPQVQPGIGSFNGNPGTFDGRNVGGGTQLPNNFNLGGTQPPNLRTQTFLPGQDPQQSAVLGSIGDFLGRVQGFDFGSLNPGSSPFLGQAASALGGVGNIPAAQRIAAGTFQESGLENESDQLAIQRIRDLGGPDRGQLALENFNLFREATDPQFEADLRRTGQANAAFGRVGSGIATRDLGTVTQRRGEELGRLERQLINDAAGQSLADRINVSDATLRGSESFGGRNLANQNFQLGLRNEARNEDDRGAARAAQNASLALQRAGILSGLGQADFNQRQGGAAAQLAGLSGALGQTGGIAELLDRFSRLDRDEGRVERGRQDSLGQQGVDNDARRMALEIERLRTMGLLGTQGTANPFAGIQGGSQLQPPPSNIGNILEEIRRRRAASTGSINRPGGVVLSGEEGVGV